MKVINIPMQLIVEDKEQPRYTFNDESINELAGSIKEVGLLNPIKVRQVENGNYKIIFGNRRYRASRMLGLEYIPAIISENESELDIYLEQLTENIQREDFTPIEEAEAFYKLANDPRFNKTSQYIAATLGKSEQYINKKLALLTFGKRVQQIIHKGKDILPNKLSEEQVLPLKDVAIEYRDHLALKIASDQANVSSVKKIAEIFLDKKITTETKESLVKRPVFDLLNVWDEYKRLKSQQTKKVELKAVNTTEDVKDLKNLDALDFENKKVAIIKQLEELLQNLPSRHEIPDEVFATINDIKIDDKDNFIKMIDMVIDCLMGHVDQWQKVKQTINSKKNISIVK